MWIPACKAPTQLPDVGIPILHRYRSSNIQTHLHREDPRQSEISDKHQKRREFQSGHEKEMANIRRRLLREEKQRIMDNFIQAQAIAVDISALFAKDGKIAHPWDYYPELFEKEQKAYEEAEEARQWEEYMEKRRAYNAEWNYRHNH